MHRRSLSEDPLLICEMNFLKAFLKISITDYAYTCKYEPIQDLNIFHAYEIDTTLFLQL